MKKHNKDALNKQRQKAKEMREKCDEIGRPDIGVEFTNIVYECEQIIKRELS